MGKVSDESGVVLVYVLITMMVLSILGVTILSIASVDYTIADRNLDSTSAYYLAESKILMALNKDKYPLKKILQYYIDHNGSLSGFSHEYYKKLPSGKHAIIIDESDLEDGDKNPYVILDFGNILNYDKKNVDLKNIYCRIITYTEYNGAKRNLMAEFNPINFIYHSGEYLVFSDEKIDFINYGSGDGKDIVLDDLTQSEIDKLTSVLSGREDIARDNIRTIEDKNRITYLSSNIGAESIDGNVTIKEGEEVFIYLNGGNRELHLGAYLKKVENNGKDEDKEQTNKYVVDFRDDTSFTGIIYVEGDVYTYKNVDFNGIMIIKGRLFDNGAASERFRTKINGLLIIDFQDYKSKTKFQKIEMEYNQNIYKKNGKYLNNFIKPELKFIKEIPNQGVIL